MKMINIRINILALFLVGVLLFSCQTEESKTIKETKVSLPVVKNPFLLDLRPYEIEAQINLPEVNSEDGNSNSLEVLHQLDDFSWEIHIAPDFTLLIEDWGNEDGFLKNVEQLKAKELETVEESENSWIAKDKEGLYHIVGQKEANGIHYIFKSSQNGAKEEVVPALRSAIQSFVAI